jgi:hypothetical protein
MDIAGHVSRQMLKHYSHIRMKAKREALDAVWKKQQESADGKGPEQTQAAQVCSPESRDRRTLKGSPYKSPYNRVFRGFQRIGGRLVSC